MEDERRHRAEIREIIDFAVKVVCGTGDEPTEQSPVISTSHRTERADVRVKKVLDFKHEDRVKAMAEESMRLKSESDALLAQVLEQAKADLAKKKEDTGG